MTRIECSLAVPWSAKPFAELRPVEVTASERYCDAFVFVLQHVEVPLHEADGKEYGAPPERRGKKGHAQDHRTASWPDPGNGLSRPEQLSRCAFHPRAHKESHHRSRPSAQLPTQLFCSHPALETYLHHWRDRRRNWRRLRL